MAKGYHGAGLQILNDAGATVGDVIAVTSKNAVRHTGILMPRYEYADGGHIVIKLKSGYNVGIDTRTIENVAVIDDDYTAAGPHARHATKSHNNPQKNSREDASGPVHKNNNSKTKILLLSTGGTIASRIDYRTGAVTPVLSADDLLRTVPELGDVAAIDAKVVFSEYSENIMPEHWRLLASEIVRHAGYLEDGAANQADVAAVDDDAARSSHGSGHGSGHGKESVQQKYDGVIIAHGTDTMHYTSAFLSFALAKFPIPIVLVGAQRSSDRASSDAAANLIGAARFIASHKGKNSVYVAMHKEAGDDAIACHMGTRVRKNHTSKRNAFQTVGAEPAFVISANGDIAAHAAGKAGAQNDSNDKKYVPRIFLDQKVALVKYYPGYDSEMLNHIIDSKYKAIIFEGTGLGHVGKTLYKQIARAARNGIFLGMTSQCIEGRVRMTVYESGRDLTNLGVVPLYDMIPEVALVKAMWAAGCASSADEIKEIMLQNIASEVTMH